MIHRKCQFSPRAVYFFAAPDKASVEGLSGGRKQSVTLYRVDKIVAIRGEAGVSIKPGSTLVRVEAAAKLSATEEKAPKLLLQGVPQHLEYMSRAQRDKLSSRPDFPPSKDTVAVVIPIRKSAAWWALAHDERSVHFQKSEGKTGHTAIGASYVDRIHRKLYHTRYAVETRDHDFITYFEFDRAHTDDFKRLLTTLGDGVACIWEETFSHKTHKLKWARFDGAKWSPIEEIPAPPRAGLVWCRPQLHAVSVGGKEIYLASGFRNGVLSYRDGKWNKEPIDVPFGGRLSVAGDKTVVVVAAKSETTDPRKGPMLIQAWQRGVDGNWSGPHELAREEQPLTGMEGLNELRPGLVVQAYAPPNFVPIAWSCKGQKWIKYLRIPVGEKK